MIPKKPKETIREVAEQRGIPEEHMAMMVKGFYKELKLKLQDMETPKIMIPGLGYITASRSSVKKAIAKYRRIRESRKNSVAVQTSEEKLNKLYGIEEILDREYEENTEKWKERKKEKEEIKKKLKDDTEGNTATGME